MNLPLLIARESAVSIAINTVLSILFFIAVFGLSAPVRLLALGPDFLPQSFMIALMGTLVPSLLLRKKAGAAAVRPILVRSLMFAIAAALIGGGMAFVICSGQGAATLAPMVALIVKAAYGAVLAAIVTPLALRALFAAGRGARA